MDEEEKGTDQQAGWSGDLEEIWGIFPLTHVPYRIVMFARLIDRLATQMIREEANLSLADWRVMAHLAALGPATVNGLSAAALVNQAEVSRAVTRLEQLGHVQRSVNPRNRKSSLITLTAQGDALARPLQAKRRQFFAEVTQDLTEEELRGFDAMMHKMAARASALREK